MKSLARPSNVLRWVTPYCFRVIKVQLRRICVNAEEWNDEKGPSFFRNGNALGVLLLAGLLFLVFVAFRWLPESTGAPQVGQKAPGFTLTDANDKPVTRAQLLTEPINNKPQVACC
jgi:hypothetical protein